MDTNFYTVIMAGGGGTRLWPLSRRDSPKQLLKIIKNKSLFRIALDRLDGLLDLDHIYVVTVEEQIAMLREEAPELPLENYLIEPMPKGTASVVGLAATYLHKIDSDAVMAVLTADHVIENVQNFQNLLVEAKNAAAKGRLVTLGIKPTFPSTGYGYIKAGKKIEGLNVHKVLQFKEKPDLDTAKKYHESNTFFWNSGMFIWSTSSILEEFRTQMPNLYQKLLLIQNRIQEDGQILGIEDIWETIQPQTIDYGIMEGASDVVVLPAIGLGWIIQSTDSKKMIAVVGLRDIIIVDHKNTLLVCKRGETQKIRQVIKKLKEQDLKEYF